MILHIMEDLSSNRNKNYAQIEKEGLAVVNWLKQVTSDAVLSTFLNSDWSQSTIRAIWRNESNACISQRMTLSVYEYALRCRKECDMSNIDALYKIPLRELFSAPVPILFKILWLINLLNPWMDARSIKRCNL